MLLILPDTVLPTQKHPKLKRLRRRVRIKVPEVHVRVFQYDYASKRILEHKEVEEQPTHDTGPAVDDQWDLGEAAAEYHGLDGDHDHDWSVDDDDGPHHNERQVLVQRIHCQGTAEELLKVAYTGCQNNLRILQYTEDRCVVMLAPVSRIDTCDPTAERQVLLGYDAMPQGSGNRASWNPFMIMRLQTADFSDKSVLFCHCTNPFCNRSTEDAHTLQRVLTVTSQGHQTAAMALGTIDPLCSCAKAVVHAYFSDGEGRPVEESLALFMEDNMPFCMLHLICEPCCQTAFRQGRIHSTN